MALQQKTVLETILIRFSDAGQIQGIAAIDKAGVIDDTTGAWMGETTLNPAREIAAADLSTAAIDPTLAAQQATITAQAAQLAADAVAATKAAADLAAAQAQIAQLTAVPTAPSSNAADTTLASLNALFATIPAAEQAQFASVYATVRVLVQAGQPALAAAVVQGVSVPDALAALKAQILGALTPATTPAPAQG